MHVFEQNSLGESNAILELLRTLSWRNGESSQLYALQPCFVCYMETSQRHQMLALTAVVSHFQRDIMSFKTSRLLPRSGGGARVIGLEEWRNWAKGRNKHGLIFILELSVWHLFTPGGILQVKPRSFMLQNMQGYFSLAWYRSGLTTQEMRWTHRGGWSDKSRSPPVEGVILFLICS